MGFKFFFGCRNKIPRVSGNMCHRVVFKLGESFRVTFSSRDVAWLKSVFGLINFMLSSDLRRRWSPIPRNVLSFPKNILSKEHLPIIAGKWKIRKEQFNLYEFVRTLHYLDVDEVLALHLLKLRCERCSRNDWPCSHHHIQENGWYNDYDLFQSCTLLFTLQTGEKCFIHCYNFYI